MDQNIKQRLVGIAVIFAIAVIFLPMILDGSGVEKKTLVIEIPDQPVVAENSEFEQKIIELHASVEEIPALQARLIDEDSGDKPNIIKREKAASQVASVEKIVKPKAKSKWNNKWQ